MPANPSGLFADFVSLFYPRVCLACKRALLQQEHYLCNKCEADMPLTGQISDPENNLIKRFTGRVKIEGAAAFYEFRKEGPVQDLMHNLKYKGQQEIGAIVGEKFGQAMKMPDSVIRNIDLVVPVPLFWKKERKRGYNQCDTFSKKIAELLGAQWTGTALERVHENVSQTSQSRFDRYANVESIFAVKDAAQLKGKHVLLIDDVVTTGATAEECLQTILKAPDTRVSFAAIAAAARF